jgi:hypothetical protein
VTSLAIIVLSIIQTQNQTQTSQGTKVSKILKLFFSLNKISHSFFQQIPSQGTEPCDEKTIWGEHRPFRVIFRMLE